MYPTPIEEMPRLRDALGGGARLYIKHDEYSGPAFGGNKVRKLEYLFAAAQQERADVVLTIGGLRSNHARATAALAANLGMECHLILNGEADAYACQHCIWTSSTARSFIVSRNAKIAPLPCGGLRPSFARRVASLTKSRSAHRSR